MFVYLNTHRDSMCNMVGCLTSNTLSRLSNNHPHSRSLSRSYGAPPAVATKTLGFFEAARAERLVRGTGARYFRKVPEHVHISVSLYINLDMEISLYTYTCTYTYTNFLLETSAGCGNAKPRSSACFRGLEGCFQRLKAPFWDSF